MQQQMRPITYFIGPPRGTLGVGRIAHGIFIRALASGYTSLMMTHQQFVTQILSVDTAIDL